MGWLGLGMRVSASFQLHYIALYWHMVVVVVGGECPTTCKKGEELSGRVNVRGNISWGECPTL